MNNVILIGRLTSNPELRTTGTGKSTCTVNIAVDRFAVEEDKQSVDFIPIQLWGKAAENLCEYQEKGNQVAVEGTLRIDNYQDAEGNTKYKTYVLVNKIKYLSKVKHNTEGEQEESFSTLKQDETLLDDDDLPF
jgi:single-strand DNA-binding protein